MRTVPDADSVSFDALASWFDDILCAERQALGEFLEHRHRAVAASLEKRLLQAPKLAFDSEPAERVASPAPKPASKPEPEEMFKEHSAEVSLKEAQSQPSAKGVAQNTKRSKQAKSVAWPKTVTELVNWPFFEIFFTVVIIVNSVVTAAEVQYRGARFGESMGWHENEATVLTVDHTVEAVVTALGWIFGVIFTIELILKLVADRIQFFRSTWNLFDFIVIAFWLFNEVFSPDDLPLDPMTLRLIRMARILKIMRMLHVLNTVDAVATLKLLMRTIACSGSILFWTVLFFLLVVFLMSLVMNFLLDGFITDTDVDEKDRELVYRYFGTFSKAILSMFELTIGNWVPITRAVTETVSEAYMVPLLFYKLSIGFAVVNILSACFMHETFKVAANDNELMVMARSKQTRAYKEKMNELFLEVDHSGDGRLSWDEFENATNDERLKTWLSAMELDVSDALELFKLIDDGDGHITADELISGVKKLKGTARSIDLVTLMRDVEELGRDLRIIKARELGRVPSRPAPDGFVRLNALEGKPADSGTDDAPHGDAPRVYHAYEALTAPTEGATAHLGGGPHLPRPHESAAFAVSRGRPR